MTLLERKENERYGLVSSILFATAERSVLQNMRHASIIWWIGFEADREYIIAVFSGDV